MVDVTIDGEHAVFEVEGWDRLWSLRSRLEIPLAHISGVEANRAYSGRRLRPWLPQLICQKDEDAASASAAASRPLA